MVTSVKIKSTFKIIVTILILCIAITTLTACGDNGGVSRKEYNELLDIIQLNDEYDLIDVRNSLNNFAALYINAESQDDIDSAVSFIEPYSTSALQSSLKIGQYQYRTEQKDVKGIYYCSPDNSSDGKGKFLVIYGLIDSDQSTESKDNGLYSYMMFTLNSSGQLTQIERW